MTESLAVLKTLVNWALKSCLWPNFHLQTFTEQLLLVGYRESLLTHQVCETQPDSKGYWSHIRKESQIQKKKKKESKNVIFLNLYCNISDLAAEIQVLVYFCLFFFPPTFYISHIGHITWSNIPYKYNFSMTMTIKYINCLNNHSFKIHVFIQNKEITI